MRDENGKTRKLFKAEIAFTFKLPMEYSDYFTIIPSTKEFRNKARKTSSKLKKCDTFLTKILTAIDEANQNLKYLPIQPTDLVYWRYDGDLSYLFFEQIKEDKKCNPKIHATTVTWNTFGVNKPAFLSYYAHYYSSDASAEGITKNEKKI